MTLRVLDATNAADIADWIALWQRIGSEPFAHPWYVRALARPDERPLCLASDAPDRAVLFPFLERLLPAELEVHRYDATGPFGYAGAWAQDAAGSANFWAEYVAWARERGLVSVVAVLPVADTRSIPPPHELTRTIGENVVVDLLPDLEELWKAFAHKVRKNVRRAQRERMSVRVSGDLSSVAALISTVTATLERRGVEPGIVHHKGSVTRLLSEMPSDSWKIAEVWDDGNVVSAELLLLSENRVYSHLGGTLTGSLAKRPNDLLKYEVIRWAKSQGLSQYVLGGSPRGDDGVFRYKRSFAPDGVFPLQLLAISVDPRAVASLAEVSAARGYEVAPDDFFPPYRWKQKG